MSVSQEIFSRITLGLHVDQFVISELALADSTMVMQLCRHYWQVKNLQQCAKLLATPTMLYLAGQLIVKLQLRRIRCAADDNTICKKKGSASVRAKWWEHLVALPGSWKVRPSACSVLGINDIG